MNSDSTEIVPELKLELIKEAPDFETVFLERKKLIAKVDDFAKRPVTSVEDTPRMAEAKRLRLDLVKKRTFLDKLRKDMGESARKRVNLINAMFGSWIEENEDAESFLKEQEDFAVNYEAARKAELRDSRIKGWRNAGLSLDLLMGTDPGEMTTAVWDNMVAGALASERERRMKADEESRAAQKELQERQWLQEENARLQREKDALERQQREAEEAKRREEEEKKKAEAKAKRAPDKTKLMAYCNLLCQIAADHCPKVKEESELILDTFKGKLDRLLGEFEKQIQAL